MDKEQKIEKYKQAWQKFQGTMAGLRTRRHEILTLISEKLDRQHMEKLRKKIENNHE